MINTPINEDFQQSWKDYVRMKFILPHDKGLWDELKEEEKSLYENGYISCEELYFGQQHTDQTEV